MNSFYLALGDNDFSAIYRSEGAAMGLCGARAAAREVYLCIPSQNTMEPVTERLARLWWAESSDSRDLRDAGLGTATVYAVPLAYRELLADEITALRGPDDVARDAVEHRQVA